MLKRVVLNRRRPDLSLAQFGTHWRDAHGPLLAGIPDYHDFVSRYLQDHVGATAPFGRAFDYDGITEIWQKRADALERSFATTAAYREHVMPDELRFADRGGAIAFFSRETAGWGVPRGAKLIVLVSRDGGVSDADFAAALGGWFNTLAQLDGVAGAVLDTILAETIVSLDGGEPAERFTFMLSVWCVAEACDAVAASVGRHVAVAPFHHPASVVAGYFEEVEFFDERPTDAVLTTKAPA
ncbi:MAG: EthD domain-containing protein [Sphingomonas sp.]|uniref:EthD domain-containing protein n=1 Tax=Sphingomonas sp. TaxID=28214 RepID=UPI001AC5DA5F|nr:EthD domain-containing protein [Sphingomonas sp.]MBN8816343.1 EthD domain-containing protein [Sphingomonas sp.]